MQFNADLHIHFFLFIILAALAWLQKEKRRTNKEKPARPARLEWLSDCLWNAPPSMGTLNC
jgi:hypothetical protein